MAKSTPNNRALWNKVLSEARQKFDVYPCVPMESQAITPNGLAHASELKEGNLILSYDMHTDYLVWSPVLAIHTYKNAPTVEMYKPTGFSIVCTPDHQWVVERTMFSGGKTGPNGCKGERYLDRRLLPTRDINTHMDIVWTGRPLQGNASINLDWHKHQSWTTKVLNMSPTEREAFFAAAIVYDGADQGATKKREGHRFIFSQKNLDHYFAAVLAGFCNGYYVSMAQKTDSIRSAIFTRGKRTHNTQNIKVRDAATQDVWCPSTEHETWVMVQNGVICVTGNSAYANAWAAKEYKKRGGTWSGADNRVKKDGKKGRSG